MSEKYVFDDFTIYEYEDRIEGFLNTSHPKGMADIIFYNDERGKRCGGSSTVPLNFAKASKMINLYKTVLDIVEKM